MDKIDNVYIINLPKDKERLEKSKIQLKKYNINPIVIDGVDMKQPVSVENQKYLNEYITPFLPKGLVGCALAHINVWEKIIENNDTYSLIFEDDIEFENNFLERFNNIEIPKDTDILYIGCQGICNPKTKYDIDKILMKSITYKKKQKKINKDVIIPEAPLALHAYIVKNSFIKYLINCLKKDKIQAHIDFQMLKYIVNKNSYALETP
jgi:glycosyl transferase family 25